MRSEWNAPKGKLGQCKNIIIFSRLSFEDKCFHLLFSSSFLHNHALCRLPAVLLAINTTFVVFVGCLHVSVSHVQCQGLSLIYLGSVTVILCVFVIVSLLSGCLHFGEWHSTLGRASAVSGNTTASQIIVSRPRALCTVHSAQCTVHNPSYQLPMCNVQVIQVRSMFLSIKFPCTNTTVVLLHIYKAQTTHYTNVQLFHAHTPSYHLAHAQRRSRPAP